ncbi:acyltransferase family protein [Erythrobacter vulgaris]|uniref:Acyltransferase family protein n=1 Tax=Qipengyuania vulgaris TaxID=291985 RepID=A0A844XQA3_9SPHN|nr:acyltransferase [Qipengyuania vulgaris]MXO48325.1 acyltransferase family protein [Qipengyuania vulgaris]
MKNMALWSKAKSMAEQTPPERNRYVDFLRALSILAVVIGHWLVAAPYIGSDGEVVGGHLLGILPWTQRLTWGFQVMPIFFLVGGYSNGVSWASTRDRNGHYSEWFASRIQRLINPVFPVLLVWAVFAFVATQIGMARETVRMAVSLALVPVWFLAVYLLVTALAPLTWNLWEKLGWGSWALLVAGAAAIDWLTLAQGVAYVNYLNFLFVWVGIHQLGYAWQQGRIPRGGQGALVALGAGMVLIALTVFGPYPIAMIGVPGAEITNSMPPTLALMVLGVTQTGLVLALEPWGRKLLDNITLWTATVLMNGMIMTVYLWHLTSYVLVMVLAWLAGGIGLRMAPGSSEWWWSRPVWFALYIAILLPLIATFARYERGMGAATRETPVPHLRLVIGMVAICVGLAMTAAISIASPEGVTGVRLWVVALPFIGAALVGFGPVYDRFKRLGRKPSGT